MISYSINHEDVLLRRAFADRDGGFYVDVGAGEPVLGSVTKHFYDRGWSGINVEPQAELFQLLQAERPRDINVNVALASHEGTATFLQATRELSGLSTFSDAIAERHRQQGVYFEERTVALTTLAKLLAEQADGRVIDFMSVDVEGHEREVLAGNDWQRWRPRVLVIEAVAPALLLEPDSCTPPPATHDAWESALLAVDYLFAAFDGLNRYYVRAEDRALVPRLQVPVNVFDDYLPVWHQRQLQTVQGELAASVELHRADSSRLEEVYRQREALQALAQRLERGLLNAQAELEVLAQVDGLEERDRLLRELDEERTRGAAATRTAEELRHELGAATTAAETLRDELAGARHELMVVRNELTAQTSRLTEIGPIGLDLARWLAATAHRHRWAARLAKAPIRAWSRLRGGRGYP